MVLPMSRSDGGLGGASIGVVLTTPNLARQELTRSYSPTKRVLKRSYYDKMPRTTILLMINRRAETLGLTNCLLFHLFFASGLLSRLS